MLKSGNCNDPTNHLTPAGLDMTPLGPYRGSIVATIAVVRAGTAISDEVEELVKASGGGTMSLKSIRDSMTHVGAVAPAAILAVILGAILVFAGPPAFAQNQGDAPHDPPGEEIEPPALAEMPCVERPYSVLVTVTNVKETKGTITADLHDDDPQRFLKKGEQVARVRVPAKKGETVLCMPVVKPGTYAIALYHDRNLNRQLDKNFLGIPVEPIGVSNNPPMALGPPTLSESSFEVNGPLTPITIKLR